MSDDDTPDTVQLPRPPRPKKRPLSSPIGYPIQGEAFGENEPSGIVIPVYVPPDTIPPPLPKRGKVFTRSADFLEAKQRNLEKTIAEQVARALVPLTKDVEHVRGDVAEFKLARRTRGERAWEIARIAIGCVITALATYFLATRR